MDSRSSGILLHISSLPSVWGIGDLGPGAFQFADFLAAAQQSLWQVLPLNYTHQSHGNSPYSCMSAFSGNPLLVSPELLVQDGYLTEREAKPKLNFAVDHVDYELVIKAKAAVLRRAYRHFKERQDKSEYEAFCRDNAGWLEDFGVFMAVRSHFNGALWNTWPAEIRDREQAAMDDIRTKYHDQIEQEKFFQFLFFRQWHALKKYCNDRGIRLFGDMPIYVNADSVDVWMNPGIFKLDGNKQLTFVAGVPPDYFSKTGQRWGNPVYNWDALKETGYAWWIRRMEQNLKLYDIVRIDHFRGFEAYWEIEACEETAINGKWVKAPGQDFFQALQKHFGALPIVAEDLGIITDEVKALIKEFSFPSMKVLMFAFGGDFPKGAYLPHNYIPNCVVYTGTHDNNTVRGWLLQDATEDEKRHLVEYVRHEITPENVNKVFIRLAMDSIARTAIFPLQDVLGLGAEARMNTPSTCVDNWKWRLLPGAIAPETVQWLADLTRSCSRANAETEYVPQFLPDYPPTLPE